MGGNNFSKLVGITYLTPEMQKCFDNVQYIPRKFFRTTSVRKELTRLVMEKETNVVLEKFQGYLWNPHSDTAN